MNRNSSSQPLTDDVQVKQALRESEARYHTLFHSIDQGFCVLELLFDERDTPIDYRFVETNPTFEAQTGLKDAIGKTARELVPDLDESWFRIYGKVASTGESIRFENHAPAMGRWFDVFAFRIGKPEERQVALLFRDVTADKQTEETLRAAEARLRLALGAGQLGAWELDLRTNASPRRTLRHDQIFGYTEALENWSYDIFLTHVHPEDRAEVDEKFRQAMERGDAWEFQCRILRKDEQLRWIWARGDIHRDADGTPAQALGVVQDVTDRMVLEESKRKLELERHLADRLEAERRRLGRELHDTVRQQLTGMRMLAGSLQKRLKDRAPAEARLMEDFVDVLTDTNLQVRELITGLLPTQISASYLPAALEREVRNTERWYGVLCAVTVPDRIPLGDDGVADHLFYIVREAITNAAKHAKPTNIELIVRSTNTSLILQVHDDGVGLPDGHDQAGGMGLSNMRQRAELIGAELSIDSSARTGTTLTCVLPLAREVSPR